MSLPARAWRGLRNLTDDAVRRPVVVGMMACLLIYEAVGLRVIGTLLQQYQQPGAQAFGPGTYTFSGQFNHDPGQGGTDGDTYTVTAGYGSGATASVGGGF